RPGVGEHVAWAESNAIVFCNSVLGARTDRYGDFLDASAAITGLVPDSGLHLTENRRATVILDCCGLSGDLTAASVLYPVLGYIAGREAGTGIPVFTGLDPAHVDEDKLKALGATAASAGGVALFHIVGVTPEATSLEAALGGRSSGDVPRLIIDAAMVKVARDALSTARGTGIDAVSLGTPHFSLAEMKALAELTAGKEPFDPSIEVWVSTSRAIMEQARAAGYLGPIESAGATVLTDTCTYVTPVLRSSSKTVMTNSGKWAYYAPGNIGVDVVFASLAECVASARKGKVVHDDRIWS
ncbi:MAG: aconitase X, partial [Pseudonocardiaceae bacterium]